MPARKRAAPEADEALEGAKPLLLQRLRNMWQFANLYQWIYLFGKAAKIDESLDIEDLETECLKDSSQILSDIALAILKLASPHRGLTYDTTISGLQDGYADTGLRFEIFDDQARKLFLAHAPDRNPFGDGDTTHSFADFDSPTKIIVMQQLSQWAMIHPERIRDKMEESKDMEQTTWRIEPYGWDSDDRTYFVLDDNRVYRLTDAPEPPPTALKSKSKKNRRSSGRRSSKRRRVLSTDHEDSELAEEEPQHAEAHDDGLGGMTWECLAVTLDDVRGVIQTFAKTRDDNEKILRKQLENHLLPILEKQEESRKRKELQRERELMNLAKMANAKRSSRIAGNMERRKQEESNKEEEERLKQEEASRRREEREREKSEQARDARINSRANRLQEREVRRLQHEEDLAQLSEDSKGTLSGGRLSERRRQAEIERNKQALEELDQDEEEWTFDCVCGLYGQVDDGTHSVACEVCNVWQHSKCVGVSEREAERLDFHFVCSSCRRREEEKTKPKTTIKLKLNQSSASQAATTGPALGTASKLVIELASKPSADHEVNGDMDQPSDHGPAREAAPASSDSKDTPANFAVPNSGVTNSSTLNPPGAVITNTNPSTSGPTKLLIASSKPVITPHNEVQNPLDRAPVHGPKTPAPQGNIVRPEATPTRPDSMLRTPVHALVHSLHPSPRGPEGTIPSSGGASPTKNTPEPITEPVNGSRVCATAVFPPTTALHPSPRQLILTPPTKPSEPRRAAGLHHDTG